MSQNPRERLTNRLNTFIRSGRMNMNFILDNEELGIDEILDTLTNIARNRNLIIRIGNQTFTLSNDVLNQLREIVRDQVVIDGEPMGSDEEIIQGITDLRRFILSKIQFDERGRRRSGSFFRFYNRTKLDLKSLGIYRDIDELIDNNEQCLIQCLREYGIDNDVLNDIRLKVVGNHLSTHKINMIVDMIEYNIQVYLLRRDKKERRKDLYKGIKKNDYENTINIGLYEEHYFIMKNFNVSSFSIKNYEEIKDEVEWNRIFRYKSKVNKTYRRRDCVIDSFTLVKELVNNKEETLEEITLGYDIMKTQYFNKVREYDSLEYKEEDCVKDIEVNIKDDEDKYETWFFDFETYEKKYEDKDSDIIPYLVCAIKDVGDRGKLTRKDRLYFEGPECGKKLLNALYKRNKKSKIRLIAHNCGFDANFIARYLTYYSNYMFNGRKLLDITGYYYGMEVKFKDSLSLISMPLRNFGECFGLEQGKEIMPYSIYNDEDRLKSGKYIIEDALNEIEEKEDCERFLHNLDNWNLIDGDEFNHIEYSKRYCMIDCEVLMEGYNTFKGWILEMSELNIDNILTQAQFSYMYLFNRGCFEGVKKFTGKVRDFLSKFVVGGRTMSRDNKMYHIGKKHDLIIKNGKIQRRDGKKYRRINDFDAVSLYPSAMERMPGFLLGNPKVIGEEHKSIEFIRKCDGYFGEIMITKVGIKRHFPLMSYVEDGCRNWSNDMVGRIIHPTKTELEDLIKYHKIEFRVIRGYYFNEGFNNTIKKVIKELFDMRREKKREGNKIEQVYKLIMNSGYGKTILKPRPKEKIVVKNEEVNKYTLEHYNFIESITHIEGGKYSVINMIKQINEHYNSIQVGSEILAWSKRIMNEVICLSEDNGLNIYYQDTDSIHIIDEDINKLKVLFENEYSRELIGKELGQFHSDFEMKGIKGVKDIHSTELIILGKKCYIDRLVGVKEGELINGLHYRMKGVPSKVIEWSVNGEVMDMYERMFNGEGFEFDLTMKNTKPCFKFSDSMEVSNQKIFSRRLSFNGEKEEYK